ncbi:MAG TPA: hypothetical protein VF534_08930 [Paraburkholderia sp.]
MHQQGNRPGEQATRAPGNESIATKHLELSLESFRATEGTDRGTPTDMLFAISLGWRPLGTIGCVASIDDIWAVYENASEAGASTLQPGLLRVADAYSETLRIAPRPASPTRPCELRWSRLTAGGSLRRVAALCFVTGVAAGFFLTRLAEKQGWSRSIAAEQRTSASTPEKDVLLASKVSHLQASQEPREDPADGGGQSSASRVDSPHSATSYLTM